MTGAFFAFTDEIAFLQRLAIAAVFESDNNRRASAVEEEIAHGEPEPALRPKPAESLLKFNQAVNGRRRRGVRVERTAFGASDKRGNRSRDAVDSVNTAGQLFDKHA